MCTVPGGAEGSRSGPLRPLGRFARLATTGRKARTRAASLGAAGRTPAAARGEALARWGAHDDDVRLVDQAAGEEDDQPGDQRADEEEAEAEAVGDQAAGERAERGAAERQVGDRGGGGALARGSDGRLDGRRRQVDPRARRPVGG